MAELNDLTALVIDPARWIKFRLQQSGQTYEELAAHLGKDRTVIGKMIRGTVSINAAELPSIAAFFGVPLAVSPEIDLGEEAQPGPQTRDTKHDVPATEFTEPNRWFRESLARTGRTQTELAEHMGWSRQRVNKVVMGLRRLRPEEIPQLKAFFGSMNAVPAAADGEPAHILGLPSGEVRFRLPSGLTGGEIEVVRSWIAMHLDAAMRTAPSV